MNPGAKRPPPNHGDQKKEGQLRRVQDLSPGRGRGDGDPCFHLSSSLPGLASVGQLRGMLCGALALLGDEPTRKGAQKGPQSWGKPPHR